MPTKNNKGNVYKGKGNTSFLPGSLFTDFEVKYWWISVSTIEFKDQQFEITARYESTLYSARGRLTGANFSKVLSYQTTKR